MKRLVVVAALALAACGQSAPSGDEIAQVSEQPAAQSVIASGNIISAEAVNVCFLTSEQISAAFGVGYRAGVLDATGAPYMQSCAYSGGAYDVLVSAYWADPAMPQAPLSGTLSGNTEPVPGDAEGAIFDPPLTSGGCAIAYRRANVVYTVSILNCRELAAARERLAGLSRP